MKTLKLFNGKNLFSVLRVATAGETVFSCSIKKKRKNANHKDN